MSVTCLLTKGVKVIPTTMKLTGEGAAQLYRDNIWKIHGLFRKVVSDSGKEFVNAFTTELFKILGITQNPSTAFHPQTNGQTERMNAEIEKYLRAWISYRQEDWSEWVAYCNRGVVHWDTREKEKWGTSLPRSQYIKELEGAVLHRNAQQGLRPQRPHRHSHPQQCAVSTALGEMIYKRWKGFKQLIPSLPSNTSMISI
jgi:hypothetical protein